MLFLFLFLSMCNNVAEWLVVQVSRDIDGSDFEHLINLEYIKSL